MVPNEMNKIMSSAIKSQEDAMDLMEKLIRVAEPKSVYSDPLKVGEYIVVTASEVSAGLGFGYGIGGGAGPTPNGQNGHAPAEATTKVAEAESSASEAAGMGGGGGGGGGSMARPVAVINIGPQGVSVQPIIDRTKLGIAFFTTLGAMALMWTRFQSLKGAKS